MGSYRVVGLDLVSGRRDEDGPVMSWTEAQDTIRTLRRVRRKGDRFVQFVKEA